MMQWAAYILKPNAALQKIHNLWFGKSQEEMLRDKIVPRKKINQSQSNSITNNVVILTEGCEISELSSYINLL